MWADNRISNKKKEKAHSGLISDWQSKLSAQRQLPSKVKAHASAENASTLGGLEDEDAAADIFATLEVSKGCDSRKNEVRCQYLIFRQLLT